MSRRGATEDAPAESDRFGTAPHPRQTYQLFGQERAELALLESYRAGRLGHSIILGGPEGIGKATLAWRFARFLLAHPDSSSPEVHAAASLEISKDHPVSHRLEALSHSDVFLLRREVNPKTGKIGTQISVDDVRRMIERYHHASASGGWRIGIIDCADDLNKNSANALLKLIEEPPPRSLFLFVANRPAQVMPTIRSRSQKMLLPALDPADIGRAIGAIDDIWSEHSEAEIATVAAKAHGSVREALRLLDGDNSHLDDLERLLQRLPAIDWTAAHQLVEALSSRQSEDFDAVMTGVYDWLDEQVLQIATQRPGDVGTLARFAELWEKIATSVRRTEGFNLDRRPFLLTMINDLAGAAAVAANANSTTR